MSHLLLLIFLGFLRIFLPILVIFSIVWAPYVFWSVYRKTRSVDAAVRATIRMIFAAWFIEPVMIAGLIAVGAAVVLFSWVPLVGPLLAVSIFKPLVSVFNRVNRAFFVPGRATLTFAPPRGPYHHGGEYSNPIIDAFHQETQNSLGDMTDNYSADSAPSWTSEAPTQPIDSVSAMQGDQSTFISFQETVSYESPSQSFSAMQGDQATSILWQEDAQGSTASFEGPFFGDNGGTDA